MTKVKSVLLMGPETVSSVTEVISSVVNWLCNVPASVTVTVLLSAITNVMVDNAKALESKNLILIF